jgi:archaemetzincin
MALLKAKIVVVPLGEVDFTLVNRLATEIGPVFERSVDILKGMNMPEEALNVIRNQYYARVALSKLERAKANQREKVIAITEDDLYLPDQNSVVGYGDSLSGVAIVSLFQIRQEFSGLPEDESKVYERLYKEAAHQLGFVFDLIGCRNARCVHFSGENMMEIDSKANKFCDVCTRQLTGKV